MTDFHKMSAMMKDLFPSDPTADKKALMEMAGQRPQPANPNPNKNYVKESINVPQGSMPLEMDSISDFAKLAGIVTEGKQRTGSAGQAKGSDPMPKMSKPSTTGEQPHPLRDKLVGEKDQDDPSIAAIDNSFGQSSLAKEIGYSPTGEVYKALIRAIKAVMPDALEDKIKQAALAAAKEMEESVSEDNIDVLALTPAAVTVGGAIDPDMDPSALIARGLEKAGEGQTLSQDERKAVKPYIALFTELLTNPAYRHNIISMQKALRKKQDNDEEKTDESGLQYYTGVKKYGKEGMTKIQSAAGKGASHEEIGKIKDKYDKTKKEESIKERLYKELNKYR